MKRYRIYVTADDPYCAGALEFSAYHAEIINDNLLKIDGKIFTAIEGFRGDLIEVKNG